MNTMETMQIDGEEEEKVKLVEDNLDKLQDYFMSLREIGGMPITKDNCEDLFNSWLEDISLPELIKIID